MSQFLPKLKNLTLFIVFVLVVAFLGQLLFNIFHPNQKLSIGVSFSPKFAGELKLDWKKVYLNILDDLKARRLRLPTYWDVLEPDNLKYDFSSSDFMLSEAQKRGVKVILTVGARQYRWPECHIPKFAKSLSVSDRQQKVLSLINSVVERYKSNTAIEAWEVENEPFFSSFGAGCDKPDINFLRSEVELVRSLDKRPIILTDSGELRLWVEPMELSDVFGTTIYRTVYNKNLGFLTYPILPYFYNIKSNIIKFLFAPKNQKTIIIELQAEPWSPKNSLANTPISDQVSFFSLNNFKDNISFARQTGFNEVYLWGVEWWYFMAQKGHPEYWEYAKTLFNETN